MKNKINCLYCSFLGLIALALANIQGCVEECPASTLQVGFYDIYGNQTSNNFTLTLLNQPLQYQSALAASTPQLYVMTNWPMTISNVTGGNYAFAVRGWSKVLVLAVPPNDTNTWWFTSLINSNVAYYAKLGSVFTYWPTNLDAWAGISPQTFTAQLSVVTNGQPIVNLGLINANGAGLTNVNAATMSNTITFTTMIMGQATNPIIFLNSNIYVLSAPANAPFTVTNLYVGTYTNVTPLPSSAGGFGLWFQKGGSNYLTMNNPQWNSDYNSTWNITIGVQTNNDTDGNLIGEDNFDTSSSLTASNAWQFPNTWIENVNTSAGPFPYVLLLNYGAPLSTVLEPSPTTPKVYYVSSKWGSDFFDGRSSQTALASFFLASVYFATNTGSIIYLQNGFQTVGGELFPQVSVIGPGSSSNLCWVNGDINCEGNCTIAKLAFYSEGQIFTGQYGHNWDTNGPTFIRDCYINAQGQEPFWTENGGPPVLPYPTVFINDEIYGDASWGYGSNVLFKNCTFRQPTPSGGSYGYCGMIIASGGGGPQIQWEGDTFIVGTANTAANGHQFVLGQNGIQPWTNFWGQGNSFNTNACPSVILITNGATIRMATF